VLPPPPAEGDVRDAADLAVFRNTRRFEGTPRWRMAQRDNVLESGFLRFYGTAELHEQGPMREAIFTLFRRPYISFLRAPCRRTP